ncbi:MAG: signal peptidase II [Bdellovibrionaceae bacterium]|nr:signal peptidase II [Pseudobdellovibrionaceae bacterium]
MRKREWLLVFSSLIFVWVIDRVTKLWANGLTGIQTKGPFNFVLHHNHGAMLGLFTDLPGVLRVVTLSTGGAFILCTYALIQFMLPIKSLLLRVGLSILTGGILGNVADRIFWGYVVDFIVIGNPTLSSPAFNLADALQWIGYGFIILAVIKEGQILWPENDIRKHYWVNRRFQLKYSFFLVGVGLSLTLIGLVFSYTYLRVTISELVGNNPYLLNKFIVPFVIAYGLICLTFCGLLFALGKYLSHRIAGPIFAFERFLRESLDGRDRGLKLRVGDDFKHLEVLAEDVRTRLKEIRQKQEIPQTEEFLPE